MPLVFTLFPYVKMEHFNWDVKLKVMFMVLCVGMRELVRNVPQNFYIICKVLVMMPFKSSVDKSKSNQKLFFHFVTRNDWQV